MKTLIILFLALFLFPCTISASPGTPDSTISSPTPPKKNGGRDGLHCAWRIDKKDWPGIGIKTYKLALLRNPA
ncbi:MAG: hypothetical protein H6696_12395 [Deferribacteres bacterium]|nr:hypothetical protein [candidate division KSB1 bacterium]MCB9502726.1 hypothetical protein [Deferribacteres bacterium]